MMKQRRPSRQQDADLLRISSQSSTRPPSRRHGRQSDDDDDDDGGDDDDDDDVLHVGRLTPLHLTLHHASTSSPSSSSSSSLSSRKRKAREDSEDEAEGEGDQDDEGDEGEDEEKVSSKRKASASKSKSQAKAKSKSKSKAKSKAKAKAKKAQSKRGRAKLHEAEEVDQDQEEDQEEEDDQGEGGQRVKTETGRPPVFVFTGASTSDKRKYMAAVTSLGGRVVDEEPIDYTAATHVLAWDLKRSEKVFVGIAGQKALVRTGWVDASAEAGRWLVDRQNEFLWEHQTEGPGLDLAKAVGLWKQRKPFVGWRAFVQVHPKIERTYLQILTHGGAEVVVMKRDGLEELIQNGGCTHAFIEEKTCPLDQATFDALRSSSALIYGHKYLIEHLLANPSAPDRAAFEIAKPSKKKAPS